MLDNMAEQRLNRLLESCGHNSHTHLYYLGDKELFWDSMDEAVIAYRTAGKRNIALGDPVGSPEGCRRVIGEFIAYCKKLNRLPVFYQAKSKYLPLFSGYGLHSAKIGEEAQIDLTRFDLKGKRWLKLRNRINKFERGRYSVNVLFPPYSYTTMSRLQEISDEWLAERKEKSFSVGAFSWPYVSRFPVAVLTDAEGRYIAFASITGDAPRPEASLAGHCRKITIDLMRYTPSCPHGTMDYLFVSLFRWAADNGYGRCSLGIAPLANMDHLLFVRLLWKYGSKLYNFKGLYEYKNKFGPDWENVYLVCPASSMPVTVGILAYTINTPVSPSQTKWNQISS
ncbi:phosphatidylglycerol lysyltransferase domain-containing protein [Paenibacillus thailandensis]|uniref:Phosphatidylglycerol lysyltransferase domain-containing protein n=1 Tax=Paenibacillus thailandensis TaxID=393250 RepID=A0ABW5QW64_9BACL